ncbi:50S ribosomal protein L11 methyltransferase [Rhabdaerophilum calidifontis]|uniref:50S ribosomal protein L11 methyltransferase n=1 Tax=Rhabdaerophilum calidifontis TaxID=2604328 RepID=UPI001239FCA1|nr:50S ribosomal protein L11 methyltransferase [Rhabdaerophilum calidifontis]
MPPPLIARLLTDEATATRLADEFSERFEPEELAASAFEIADDAALPVAFRRPDRPAAGREGPMGTLLPDSAAPWQAELVFAGAIDEAAIRALVAEIAGAEAGQALVFERIEARDWIAASLEGLEPVSAGRFTIHGAHDRAARRPNRVNIEIEAALAFGTGHHGTTRGCLLLLDSLLKRRRPAAIVDIGSGTGVLAMAAAAMLKRRVRAGEIDPDSVRIARANARLNGVPHLVRPVVAAGLKHPALRARGTYDLVFANILAGPLKRLAPEIAAATAPGGHVILSGMLAGDVPGMRARYGAFGFRLRRRIDLEGWSSLLLAK